MTTIRISPDKDMIRILTALGIEWDLALSKNGEGDWTLVEMTDEAADLLHDVCDQMLDLRARYLEASHYNQLPLEIR